MGTWRRTSPWAHQRDNTLGIQAIEGAVTRRQCFICLGSSEKATCTTSFKCLFMTSNAAAAPDYCPHKKSPIHCIDDHLHVWFPILLNLSNCCEVNRGLRQSHNRYRSRQRGPLQVQNSDTSRLPVGTFHYRISRKESFVASQVQNSETSKLPVGTFHYCICRKESIVNTVVLVQSLGKLQGFMHLCSLESTTCSLGGPEVTVAKSG
jgi:hypothetical protein